MGAFEALSYAAENVFGLDVGGGFEDVAHELGGNALGGLNSPVGAFKALSDATENVFGLDVGSSFEDVAHELGGNAARGFAGDVGEELPAVHAPTAR